MKYHVFLIAALFPDPLFSFHAAEVTPEHRTIENKPLAATVFADRVLEKNFLGFGMEWKYEGDRPDNNVRNLVWTNHWREIVRRVDFMRPSILRVMHDARMYTRIEQGRIVADYESPRMQVTYRILDYAKSRDIPVVFGEWWLPQTYFEPVGGNASPRWSQELVAPFLLYLRERRGYTNILYFNLMNEPAGLKDATGDAMGFATWKAAIINLHTALKEKGLGDKVRIVGTDGPGDFNRWIEKTAKDGDVGGCIGAYEYHLYAHLQTDKWSPSLLEGKLETSENRRRLDTATSLRSRRGTEGDHSGREPVPHPPPTYPRGSLGARPVVAAEAAVTRHGTFTWSPLL